MIKNCIKCNKVFNTNARFKKFCGDLKSKTGCAYFSRLEYWKIKHKRYMSKPENRKRKYEREKERRKLGYKSPPYKLRFKVFLRDNFTCQYCGRKSPEIEIQIDHIIPKSRGGKDLINNFLTACKDCNLGKSDMLLNN